MKDNSGKTAIITGAASGIGFGTRRRSPRRAEWASYHQGGTGFLPLKL
jgi:hypothetical protein